MVKNNNKNFSLIKFKSLYLTFLGSVGMVLLFSVTPVIIDYKKNSNIGSKETANNSKTNFNKTLENKKKNQLNKNKKEVLDSKKVFNDVFEFDDIPTDTVRLSAATIEQLFKDTNYNLTDVRETKLVKPISLQLLPEEMKEIENTKKRKNLFIQIILPLVIEENNRIKLDRRKLFTILNKNNNSLGEKKWLDQRFKLYGVSNKDVSILKIRLDEIPASLAIAQAAKETGWGTSRFALEGNALFGQWTWSGEGIKPAGADKDSKYKVMKFKVLKASVRAYQRNLNTHSGYKNFRMARAKLRDEKKELDSTLLSEYLDNYAETGQEYIKILKQIIKQNNLTDFDDVKLLPSSLELKSLI